MSVFGASRAHTAANLEALREALRCGAALLVPVLAVAATVMMVSCTRANAEDRGQWNNYRLSDQQKAWFKTVLDSIGNTCCDGADGYPVDYEMRDNKYWVLFRGQWLEVDETAVRHQSNPIGEAVAWFYYLNGDLTVRCFVPGPGG
jgi:hypothetical protein